MTTGPVVIEHRHLDPTPPGVDQLVQTSGADSAASVPKDDHGCQLQEQLVLGIPPLCGGIA